MVSSADRLTWQDIFQFFAAQLLTNLKPPVASRAQQPVKNKSTGATQESQSQSLLPGGSASQRVTDVPYYTEYCYLLESLATIKSVVLACDVPGGEELVTEFFEGFTQIVR
jgi:sister-chromatid-cohesion protein PDS5